MNVSFQTRPATEAAPAAPHRADDASPRHGLAGAEASALEGRRPDAVSSHAAGAAPRPQEGGGPALRPPVDIVEDATGITLLADLAGVPRERLALRVDGDELQIEGEMALDLPSGLQPHHAELRHAVWRRAFTLSKELDAERVSAELNQGVLRVRIPKAEHSQRRRVEVQLA